MSVVGDVWAESRSLLHSVHPVLGRVKGRRSLGYPDTSDTMVPKRGSSIETEIVPHQVDLDSAFLPTVLSGFRRISTLFSMI